MGAFEKSFVKASDDIGYTIYRCTDFNAGKFFDVPATNKYFGDWSKAFTTYETCANEHFLAMDAVATTDTWMGVDADAAKTLLSDTVTTLLEDILKLHDDTDSLHATILDNFKLTVDSAADAYISYDDLMKIENDFKEKAEAYDTQAKAVEDMILDLQEKYSKYGTIRTQDFAEGRTAFTNLCGDDKAEGYLAECRQKLVQFDNETQILIEEADLDKRVDDLNIRMTAFLVEKHPENLASYLMKNSERIITYPLNKAMDMMDSELLCSGKMSVLEYKQMQYDKRVSDAFETIENIDSQAIQGLVDTDIYKGYKKVVSDYKIHSENENELSTWARVNCKILAYGGEKVGDSIKEKSAEIIDNQTEDSLLYNAVRGIFEGPATIQSFLENGDCSKTREYSLEYFKSFAKGFCNSGADLISGVAEMPEFSIEVVDGIDKGIDDLSQYIGNHNISEYPEDLSNWLSEKKSAIKNIEHAAAKKISSMEVKDYYEATGYLAAFSLTFFIGGSESKAVSETDDVADVGRVVKEERTLAEINETEKVAEETGKIAEVADEARAIEEIGEAGKVAESGNIIYNSERISKGCTNSLLPGGKDSTGYKYWKESIDFQGNKVYQRNDLFDPAQISSWKDHGKTVTGTNVERIASGRAPIGYDGKSVNLHHLLQTPEGPIVEVSKSFHNKYYSTIHMNTGQSPSIIDRDVFKQWKSDYWMNRALDFD